MNNPFSFWAPEALAEPRLDVPGEQLRPASLELRQVEAGISKLGVESRGRHLRSSAWTVTM